MTDPFAELEAACVLCDGMRTGYLKTHPNARPSPRERELIAAVRYARDHAGVDYSACLPEPFRHLVDEPDSNSSKP